MNLGFYVDTNAGTPENKRIYEMLNDGVESSKLTDASVFFNTVGFNPVDTKFGMFDATELWSFTGVLVCTTVENAVKANNVVNRFRLHYLFTTSDKSERNLFTLVSLARNKDVAVLVSNVSDQKEFYRLTGVKPKIVELTVDDLKEVCNE